MPRRLLALLLLVCLTALPAVAMAGVYDHEMFMQAQQAMQEGHEDQAIQICTNLLPEATGKNRAVVYTLMGWAWINKNDMEMGQKYIDLALKHAGDDYVEPLFFKGGILFRKALNASDDAQRLAYLQQAKACFETYRKGWPGKPPSNDAVRAGNEQMLAKTIKALAEVEARMK